MTTVPNRRGRRLALGLLVAALGVGVLVSVAVSQGVGRQETSCTTPSSEIQTFQYATTSPASENLTSLDVYASPDAEGCPVLVWVHGGSWQAGDKSTRLTRLKAAHFIEQGWIFVSVNYRLAAADNDVRWPAFGDDLAASVKWLVDNVGELGGDPAQISLVGHSSGAHLVSIVGTHPDLLARQGVEQGPRCVVSLDSVTHDLTDPPPWEVDIIELAFPNTADQIDGSPSLQVSERDRDTLPDFLIVTRGRQERIDSSLRLASELTAAGGMAEVADLSPYDHSQVSTELGVEGETMVTPVVDGFLVGCQAAA